MEDVTRGGMYLVIPAAVAEDTRLRERSKLIYGRIVQLAASTGFCYASNQALLEILAHKDPKTGEVSVISERTLQSILAELRDRGHIHMDTGPVPCSGGAGTVTRRRIFVGQKLAEIPPSDGGAENFTPADFCTPGVKKISPPFNSKNSKSEIIPPLPPTGDERVKAKRDKSVPAWKPERFEAFWAYYRTHARGEDRQGAVSEWDRLRPDDGLIADMGRALQAQVRSEDWQRGIGIPYAKRWLKNKRWQDQPKAPPPTGEEPGSWEERFGWH